MAAERFTVAVECRASESGPVLRGVILTEGRAARGGRAELFAPGACCWAADGIGIGTKHLAPPETRAVPVRDGNEIRVECPATPELFRAVSAGAKFVSVEFHALAESRQSGIREIEQAVIVGAIVCDSPEYAQTSAEVRTALPRVWWRPW